jgi:hypothetical protein
MGDSTKACPSCAEQVQAAARICLFCKYDFERGVMAAPPPPPARAKSTSSVLVIVILCVVGGFCLLGILPALLLPAIARAIRNAKVTRCVNNLAQLYKMQHNYAAQYGGPDRLMPIQTGGQFWLHLNTMTPPLIDSTLADIYACPMEGNLNAPGTTDYRGPALNVNRMADGDPIGADKVGNHGPREGGNVIRKSGDVVPVSASDPLWMLAESKTSP